jgi:PAS domain S-box-containing protein
VQETQVSHNPLSFQQIVEMSNEAIWVMDRDLRVAYVNLSAARMLGYEPAAALGRSLFDFLFPEDVPAMIARTERRRAGESERYEQRVRRADGSSTWGLVSARTILDTDGRFNGSLLVVTDISDLKRVEEALRQSKDRNRLISDNMIDVVWTLDPKTMRFTYVSPSVKRLRGWTAEEVMAQPLEAALDPESFRVVVGRMPALLESLPGASPTQTTEVFQPHRDGGIVPTEVVTTVLFDEQGEVSEILGVSRDITERKRAEAARRESEFWLRQSQRIARLGSYVFDVPANRWQSSEYLDELFGIGPDSERTTETWLALVHPDERASLAAYLAEEVIRRRQPFNLEYRIVRLADGDVRWVQGLGELELDGSGNPVRLFGTIQDVTGRHQQDGERRQLENQLLQAQKLESLGVLAGGIAHDFNNLLTSILGNADLALQDLPPGSPVRDNVLAIESSSRRAAEISQQMLAYSGRGRFVVEPLVLSHLVRDMMRMLELAVSKRTLMRVDLADELPPVEADAGQLRQMVLNLVANAAEAVGDRDGSICIATSVVQCDPDNPLVDHLGNPLRSGQHVVLEVSDSGVGMSAETLTRVFDPFFTTKFTGRGLGLPAVLGIIRGHRGSIQIDSQPGRGTTFRVLLPVLAPAVAGPEAQAAAVTPPPSRTAVVLVVDDEAGVRTLAERMVQRCGYRAVGAADGVEAIRLVRENPRQFSCVLLDLTMPRLGGEETLREIRKIAADLPVILCSGYHAQELSERFAGQGLSGFVQKPYRLADIKATLQAAID